MPGNRHCSARDKEALRGPAQLAALVLLLTALAACAPTPQRGDPDAPIPNLSSVPDRPRPVSTREARDELQAALAADLQAGDQILAESMTDAAAKTAKEGQPLGESEIVAVIYFADGSAALGAAERRVLSDVAQLQQRQGRRLKVVGHASQAAATDDQAATREANQSISEKRAEEVARALLAYGVAPAELFYIGVGDREPLYEETTASGRAGNRRAEIFLETGPQAQ